MQRRISRYSFVALLEIERVRDFLYKGALTILDLLGGYGSEGVRVDLRKSDWEIVERMTLSV